MIYIFVGPTISAADAARELDAIYRPPAACGDIYRAARQRPRAIGIIDGYFEQVPAVWHKEILWAMRAGIHVFGSASMGALRATELAAFGMEGVGAIFAAYQQGELEDDDEVAVAHAPADHGYRSLSVALVNIRATLAAAREAGVISPNSATALLALARSRFYPERGYARLFEDAAAAEIAADELGALQEWLPAGQVDQKRADALAMLGLIRERLAVDTAPKQVQYHFEHTFFWEQLTQIAGADDGEAPYGEAGRQVSGILEEARLAPAIYRPARRAAEAAALARVTADRQGRRAGDEQISTAVTRFRRARDLHDGGAMARWLDSQELSAERFVELMEEQSLLRAMTRQAAVSLAARTIDQLRLDGHYSRIEQRARHKQLLLGAAGLSEPSLAEASIDKEQLLHWFFIDQERGPIPQDLQHYALEAGFRDEHAFLRALLREYYYVKLQAAGQV